MSIPALIGTLFITSLCSSTLLASAVRHLYSLGKSRTRLKKEQKEGRLWDKLTLNFYLAGCEYHSVTAKKLCRFYWLYWSVAALCLLALGLEVFFPGLHRACEYLVLSKTFLMDLPVLIWQILMTKTKKQGNCRRFSTWAWEADKEAKG